jgi:hypothetical protein
MQIALKQRVCFLCTPKCASTSIEAAILPYCDISFTMDPRVKHLSASFYKTRIEPMLAAIAPNLQIETFCLIREPTAWISSWYRYRMRPALLKADPNKRARSTKGITFDHFVNELLSDHPRPFAQIGSQKEFMSDPDGNLLVDRVFRVEDMALVSEYLSEKFQQPIEIPKKNVSRRKPSHDLVAYRDKLHAKFYADYELYDSLPTRNI